MKSKWLSRSIIGCCFGIVTSLAIVGCVTDTKYVTVDGKYVQVTEEFKIAAGLLPPDAKNIVDIGNQWFTFDIDNRHFLMKYQDTHGLWKVVSLTELSPLTKPCTCATMSESKETKRGDGPGLVE